MGNTLKAAQKQQTMRRVVRECLFRVVFALSAFVFLPATHRKHKEGKKAHKNILPITINNST